VTKSKIINSAKTPAGIVGILAVLGGGSFGSYTAVRDFIIGPILVNMKAGEVRENIMIMNQKKILDYAEMWTRLNYRADDIKAVKLEMKITREWD